MNENQEKNTPHSRSAEELAQQLQRMLDEQWHVESPMETEGTEQIPDDPELRPQPNLPAPERKREKSSSVSGKGLFVIHDFAYILAVVVLLFTFFIRVSWVEGDSMNPTLVDQDQMLLLSSVWYQTPQRGDVVVARIPGFSKDPIVKRVIALEGDMVDIDFESGVVYINDQALDEPYISEPTYRNFGEEGSAFPMKIEPGHVFLMGDNRNDSYDSRYASIGQVDERCILGRVVILAFPGRSEGSRDFSRFGFIDRE